MSLRPTVGFILLTLIVLGFGTYRLSESPATWVDEGMIDQLAINLAEHGVIGIQTAPGVFSSGAYITGGFPLLFPLAVVFKMFGIGILQARTVVLLFAFGFIALAFTYLRREFGPRTAFMGGLLITLFPPYYAYAKNVLGEIPGLFFLLAFLFLLLRYEKAGLPRASWKMPLAIGVALGLCVVTKPVFLPLLGAIGLVTIWSWWKKRFVLTPTMLMWGSLGFFPMIGIWLLTQFFSTDSFAAILSFYANPYGLEHVPGTMTKNVLRFFQEGSPIYLGFAWILWAVALWRRTRRGVAVSMAERIAFTFTCLVLFFYLRTPGWYKYFFVAQILSLLYLPASLFEIATMRLPVKHSLLAATIVSTTLAGVHVFMLLGHSFVAESYRSTRSESLATYFHSLEPGKTLFLYRTPEAVIFLPPGTTYHQYILINKGVSVGNDVVERIGIDLFPDIIFTETGEDGTYHGELFPGYARQKEVNRYTVLVPTQSI